MRMCWKMVKNEIKARELMSGFEHAEVALRLSKFTGYWGTTWFMRASLIDSIRMHLSDSLHTSGMTSSRCKPELNERDENCHAKPGHDSRSTERSSELTCESIRSITQGRIQDFFKNRFLLLGSWMLSIAP